MQFVSSWFGSSFDGQVRKIFHPMLKGLRETAAVERKHPQTSKAFIQTATDKAPRTIWLRKIHTSFVHSHCIMMRENKLPDILLYQS